MAIDYFCMVAGVALQVRKVGNSQILAELLTNKNFILMNLKEVCVVYSLPILNLSKSVVDEVSK